MTMSVKEAFEVVGLIMARHFYTIFEKETLEVVGSILVSPLFIKTQSDCAI